MALFFLAAAAGPKLLGEQSAAEMFALIGFGQWFRYLVGALELAGAIGLVIPRLAGLAALGLIGVMVGAVITQLTVPEVVGPAFTPAILGVVLARVVWGRWPQARPLPAHSGADGRPRIPDEWATRAIGPYGWPTHRNRTPDEWATDPLGSDERPTHRISIMSCWALTCA